MPTQHIAITTLNMRERITFIHSPEDGVDPAELVLESARLTAPAIEAAREDRLTATLEELPSQVFRLLQDFRTLRLRWVSTQPYQTLEPYAARLSPGLHVSYSLLKEGGLEREP